MDLIYMTDAMAYQSIRGPIYEKYSEYDTQINNQPAKNSRTQKKNKEQCKICQERQRRSLMKYIRSKSHEHSDHELKEEDEEEAQDKQAQEKQEAKTR